MTRSLLGIFLFSGLLCSSCIRDEAANSECDIEKAVVSDAAVLFYNKADTVVSVASGDSTIVFYTVDGDIDDKLASLHVYFQLTPGATISPENGSPQDFSGGKEVHYRVTAEDGHWVRSYRVQFKPRPTLVTDMSFEHFDEKVENKYCNWYEVTDNGVRINQWASGNPGFKISRSSALPEDYPTLPWSETSINGHAVKLETRDTGGFGIMVNMRIAPGNLFIGTFDVSNALKDAMAATRMGLPFHKKPLRLRGYYQYVPGEKFQNRKGVELPDRVDQPDIYAVFYKNTDGSGQTFTLQGDNVLTHESIVAIARLQNPVHGTKWTEFDLPFDYREGVDEKRLRENGYSLAVVFTSSIEGAEFCGAVGSTLLIDEVKVICEENE